MANTVTSLREIQRPYFESSATITRPSDTTQYAIGDAVSNSTSAPSVLTFADIVREPNSYDTGTNGRAFVITSVQMLSTANPATLIQPQLWLFSTAPTAINDNAAFSLSDADAAKAIAVITLGSSATATNNSLFWSDGLSLHLKCNSSSTQSVFGLVKVLNAYVPVSAEELTFKVRGYRL